METEGGLAPNPHEASEINPIGNSAIHCNEESLNV